jgi:hypothetical protein
MWMLYFFTTIRTTLFATQTFVSRFGTKPPIGMKAGTLNLQLYSIGFSHDVRFDILNTMSETVKLLTLKFVFVISFRGIIGVK